MMTEEQDRKLEMSIQRTEQAQDFAQGLAPVGLGTTGDSELRDMPGTGVASTVVFRDGRVLEECFVFYGVGGVFLQDYLHSPEEPDNSQSSPKYFVSYAALEGVYQSGSWPSQISYLQDKK